MTADQVSNVESDKQIVLTASVLFVMFRVPLCMNNF